MPDFGNSFKSARESRSLTLVKLAKQTCIDLRFLRAIEDEAFHILPGGVFSRGFIRTYAKRLGLDPEAKVSEYAALTAGGGTPEPVETNRTSEIHRVTLSVAESRELKTVEEPPVATLHLKTPEQTSEQPPLDDIRGRLVWRIWDYEFTQAEQSVLQAMADHAKDDGSDCVPGLRRVAYKARLSERHVRRVWRDLEKRGILLLESEGIGRGHVAKYRICLDNAKRRPSFEQWVEIEKQDKSQRQGQLPLEASGREDVVGSETVKTDGNGSAGDSESEQDPPVSGDARPDAESIEDKPVQH